MQPRLPLWLVLLVSAVMFGVHPEIDATSLTTLEYRLTGSSLQVAPVVLSVPKGIAGSISTMLSGDASLQIGTVVEATLRGPGLPPRQILAVPGQPLLLPP